MGKAASDRAAEHGVWLPEEETDWDAERERWGGCDKGRAAEKNLTIVPGQKQALA
jgi:hypothetical protein